MEKDSVLTNEDLANQKNQVTLMLLFSLFMGASLAFYFAASTAIFLDHFNSSAIPASYMFSGVIVYLIWFILSKTEIRLSFTQKITTKMAVMLLSFSVICLGVWMTNNKWLAFILFSWIRVFVFLVFVSFWGIAGKLFNLKQGKKIFGFIGSGEVISLMLGYFSIPFLLKFFVAKDLLLFSVAALSVCFYLTVKINTKYKGKLNNEEGGNTSPATFGKSTSIKSKPQNLFKQPFIKQIAMMALLPIFGYMFMDFMFLDQAKNVFKTSLDPKHDMANFLGYFLGFVALVELVIKLFLSSKFLTKFGIKWGLLSLPLSLFITVFGGLVALILGSEGFFYFSFLLAARLSDKAMRGGFYDPSFQLLFQPLPSSERFKFQSKIDGIPKALGTIFTGAIIFGLSSLDFVSMTHFSIIYLAVVGYWIFVTFQTHVHYKKALFAVLKKAEKNKNLTKFDYPIDFLKQKFRSADEFTKNASKWMLKQITPHFFSNQEILPLKQIHPSQNWDGSLQTNELTENKNKPVLIITKNGNHTDVNPVVKKISNEDFDFLKRGHELKEKIIPEGEIWLARLQREFNKANQSNSQKRIIEIYAKIGTKTAKNNLFNLLNHHQRETQISAARALNYAHFSCFQNKDKLNFLNSKAIQIAENSVYINASINDLSNQPGCEEIVSSLYQERQENFYFLFDILTLAYHGSSVELIRKNLLDKGIEGNGIYALELIDNYFEGELKQILLALFEPSTRQKKLKRQSKFFPQESLSKKERLKDIINRSYSSINIGLKTKALKILIHEEKDIPDEVFACLFHSNPAIYEETSIELKSTSSEIFLKYFSLLPYSHQKRLYYLTENNLEPKHKISDIINLLNEIPVFNKLNSNLTHIIAATFHENSQIKTYSKNFVRLLDGKSEMLKPLRIKYGINQQVLEIEEEEFLSMKFTPKDYIEMDASIFFNLIADYPELTTNFFDLVRTLYQGSNDNQVKSEIKILAKAV